MDQISSIQNIGVILVIWSCIYLADYYFTILLAKNYQENLREYIIYEGSFELTPQFENDVDNLRLFSPQFITRWIISVVGLYGLWWLSNGISLPQIFYFLVGALILRECAVHLRHLRNFAMYGAQKDNGIKGRLEYRRWLIMKVSAWELFGFGLVYLFLAIIQSSWFFLGGVFGCWIIAFQHLGYSNKARESKDKGSGTMADA